MQDTKNKELADILREIKYKYKLNQSQIATKIGVSVQYLSDTLNGRFPFSEELRAKLSEKFTYSEVREGADTKENKYTELPLIPADAMAGALSGDGASFMEYECEKYIVPVFKGAEFLIRVQGDSMVPKYFSGDVVACQHVPLDRIWFQWGKTYVIDTLQGALIKRIEKSDKEGFISIHSENEKYSPFDLSVEEVNGVALVKGLIRVE